MSLLPLLSLSLLLLSTHTYSSPDCKSFKCGDLTIDYPFSHFNTSNPVRCGLPGLLISCENNISILHLEYDNYTVQTIDYDNHTMTLVNTDVLDPNNTCPRVQNNVSFFADSGIQYTSSDVNLTFFFECNIALNSSPISCFPSNGNGDSYVIPSDTIDHEQYLLWSRSCQMVVVVPVLEYYLEQYYNDLNAAFGQVLKKGFQLGWSSTGNCTKCTENKGQCGYTLRDDNTTYDFYCFCGNGTCGMFSSLLSNPTNDICTKCKQKFHVLFKGPTDPGLSQNKLCTNFRTSWFYKLHLVECIVNGRSYGNRKNISIYCYYADNTIQH